MTRFNKSLIGNQLKLQLSYRNNQNKTINVTIKDSKVIENKEILVSTIMYPNKTHCKQCACQENRKNSSIVSDIVSLSLFQIDDQPVSFNTNSTRVTALDLKAMQP